MASDKQDAPPTGKIEEKGAASESPEPAKTGGDAQAGEDHSAGSTKASHGGKDADPPEPGSGSGEAGGEAEAPALLTVSSSPHVRSEESVPQIMWTVFATLLPATVWAVYTFGIDAATVLATCTGGAVVMEALAQYVLYRKTSVQDGSAALTGLLLGLTMPPGASVVICLIGAFVAVVVAKAVFGGLGHNPFNPALTARVFLLIAFPGPMTRWPVPREDLSSRIQSLYGQSTTWLDRAGEAIGHQQVQDAEALTKLSQKVDVITTATPLAIVKEHWQKGTEQVMHYSDFVIGTMPGSIGEVSGLLLLVGAAFLFLKRYISWHIPVSFLVAVVAIAGITHMADPVRYPGPIFHIFTGGIIIGAFFMATDYVTSPTYPVGMIIFGLGCGALTMVIRLWGGFPEGVSFAILIMNAFVPLLERVTRPKKFGVKPWAEPEASS